MILSQTQDFRVLS